MPDFYKKSPFKGDLEGLFVLILPNSSLSRMNTGLSIGR